MVANLPEVGGSRVPLRNYGGSKFKIFNVIKLHEMDGNNCQRVEMDEIHLKINQVGGARNVIATHVTLVFFSKS